MKREWKIHTLDRIVHGPAVNKYNNYRTMHNRNIMTAAETTVRKIPFAAVERDRFKVE